LIELDYLGLVPARSGSVRLPLKNIKILAGKPLIRWTIDEALKARNISAVIVSTNSQEIKEVAEEAGAEVPFLRPDELSSNTATSVDVAVHALQKMETLGVCYKNIVFLQPTSPLRTSAHIDGAIELYESKSADNVVSVCGSEHPVEWSLSLEATGQVKRESLKNLNRARSQDLESTFRLNGAIYILSTKRLLSDKKLVCEENVYAYHMDRRSSVDIDTIEDFDFASYLLKDITSRVHI
jgi:CMP-N,N'-diacetyllegionaminic acid synthase